MASVLLLGSDAGAREELRAVLAGAGYEVTEVETAEQARARLPEFASLVLDAVSAEGGAAAFCQAIRAERRQPPLAILAIAQSDDVEERVRLFEAGADEVVARPFDPRELEARMGALEYALGGPVPGRAAAAEAPEEAPGERLIVCFSPKGGMGTTTIAVNMAVALAEHSPGEVAIFDLDTQFGQVVTYSAKNVNPKRTLAQLADDAEALDDPDSLRAYATKVEPGLDVYAAPTSPAHAEIVTRDAAARMLRTARRTYRAVVVDAGSHLDETTLDLFESADALVIVLRPEVASVRAVLALGEYLGELGSLGAQTFYVANTLFSREMVKLSAIEELLGTRVAVEIPYDPFIFLKAVNEGVPIVRAAPESIAAQRLSRLAALTMGEARPTTPRPAAQPKKRSLLPGLRFSR